MEISLATKNLILEIPKVKMANKVLDYYIRNREAFKIWEPVRGENFYTLKHHKTALKSGVKFIFNTVGLHRIEANIMPRNISSLKVVEKLGFQNEGLSPNYLKINAMWEDHLHMVLRNENLEQED